ncbi:hypothetical protein BJV74DRAFT_796480 [Russula compacta]|nr:hypothetical protein BJV74DRAFT_796480 [Russula compacta]
MSIRPQEDVQLLVDINVYLVLPPSESVKWSTERDVRDARVVKAWFLRRRKTRELEAPSAFLAKICNFIAVFLGNSNELQAIVANENRRGAILSWLLSMPWVVRNKGRSSHRPFETPLGIQEARQSVRAVLRALVMLSDGTEAAKSVPYMPRQLRVAKMRWPKGQIE